MNEGWGKSERSLSIFISSPDDVKPEREAAEHVIEDVSRSVGDRLGISLRVKKWERFRPRGSNIMTYIEEQLKTCDLFVMIFSRRFGSSPSAESPCDSGTEQEYRIAASLHDGLTKERPEIFVYFRQLTDGALLADAGPQLSKVLQFRAEVEHTRFYRQYASADSFRYEFREHLTEWLLEMADRLRRDDDVDRKRSALQNFFSLDSLPGERASALIVYPSAEKLGGDVTHLLPYMVLEDFQAIHKITKCLNIAGCDRVHASTANVYNRQRDRRHNKVFVCWRNAAGQEHLEALPQCRFRLDARSEGDREIRSIIWHHESGREIRVDSPQSMYLHLQRRDGSRWKAEPGKCVSVDFAILARFHRRDENISETYVIGIRGLGTWGAAWYLDQRWRNIAIQSSDVPNCERLLKVIYRNHSIYEVVDVSRQDETFFQSEMDQATITRTLQGLAVADHAVAAGALAPR